jgi:RNA polymerase sigma-70 factor (ECF subfamily)
MSEFRDLSTSITLLERLGREETDQQAWADFVHRYGRQIYHWCGRWKLQQADAEDLTQNVLLRLHARLRTFRYDPGQSFRAYLKALTHYAWCDLLQGNRRPGAGSGDTAVLDRLQSVEARDDLMRRLDEEFDQELLAEAAERVRRRVEPHTWEAFRLTSLEGLSGAAAAEQLGMKVVTVFKAKSKVQKMLQEEVARPEAP